MNPKQYAKAIAGAAVALTGSIAVGYADDALTKGELWAAIAAGVAAGAVVFGVRNADDKVDPDNRGLIYGDNDQQ